MDKFFLTLGVHRFWRLTALKTFFILSFVLSCVYQLYFLSSSDVSFNVKMMKGVFIFCSYAFLFLFLIVLSSKLMRKPLDSQSLAFLDENLLQALKSEASIRFVPISWSMVVKKVVEVHYLNKNLEQKRVQSQAMRAQLDWFAKQKA